VQFGRVIKLLTMQLPELATFQVTFAEQQEIKASKGGFVEPNDPQWHNQWQVVSLLVVHGHMYAGSCYIELSNGTGTGLHLLHSC
jgi:hypothetical protein